MRILYFDIDGVLLSYDDNLKPLLIGNAFESKLKSLHFEQLICLSGWSDIMNAHVLNQSPEQQKEGIYHMLKEIFPDKEWFMSRLVLAYDTDHRCKHIDLNEHWFYIDDWADKFFSNIFGKELYESEFGKRILLVDPYGNGRDLLDWVEETVPQIINTNTHKA